MSGTMRDMSHGTNGTSATPICDLIEVLMSHGTNGTCPTGQLEMALKTARAIEAALHAKPAQSVDFLLEKREKERLRKAAYRSKMSLDLSRGQSGTVDESVLLTTSKTVDNIKKTRKTDAQNVPRDNAGQKPGHESDWPGDYPAQFWAVFPRRTEKKAAVAKLDAIRKSGKVTWSRFFAGVNRYAMHVASNNTEERYVKHPTTWLNRGCWDDEFTIQNGGNRNEADRRVASIKTVHGVRAEIIRRTQARAAADAAAGGGQSGNRYPDASGVVELEASEWSASA